ncbi:Na+/H+ antiporter NhaC family protein [Rubeoparvulum massiliense]|uniref:Na+/H+ antiporter NhaC family protein n=1 Tax=Rubeoparvulum massiliense TaxID=1631346 RepID=UPI00065E4869|nr:Na+/H+ antiporter NhaC family protein [Rubeoparvulum massiliense]
MEESALSLIPPVLALVMVILTRKVLLSLGAGIVVGAFMLSYAGLPGDESFIAGIFTSLITSVVMIFGILKGIFIEEGGINQWNVYNLSFLLMLGVITSLVALSGGSRAFGEWAMKRVKTRVGAQLTTAVLGLIIFIDDYFNSLIVGNVSRPITDRQRVSRAKLAYIVDSTSAPVCVIAPISSWGAYIISIIGGIFLTLQIADLSPLSAFLQTIPMNFYAIITILFVFATAIFNLNLGKMKEHEDRAFYHNQLVDPSKGAAPGQSEIAHSHQGRVLDLVLPIFVLVATTVAFMFITGLQAVEGEVTIFTIFENTDVAASLFYGGLLGMLVTFALFIKKDVPFPQFRKGIWNGIKSMLPAIYILIFAWTIIEIIGEIGTGRYLAGLVDAHINLAFLPFLLFIIASFMSLATGTSWGTFGVMLGIAADIAVTVDPTLLLPSLASVLAGSVFGDHCSPISDTTILSSTGAGSHHIDHVITQLPYAITVGLISAVGYLVLGFTGSTIIGLLATLLLFVVVTYLLKLRNDRMASTPASNEM